MSSDNQPTPFAYTVYYRRRDGVGTRIWDRGLTQSEAIAQQRWCFQNVATAASMVWILRDDGSLLGEAMLRERANGG
jgi:hypothetical protein